MTIKENFQHILADIPSWSAKKKATLLAAGVLALDILILLIAPLFARNVPFLSVALSWLWFILPGLVLSFVLVKRISWVQRIPVSFVISIGLVTPITIAAILLRMQLNHFLLLQTGILILCLIILALFRLRPQNVQEESDSGVASMTNEKLEPLSIALLLVTIVAVGILAFLALDWPPAGDDVSGLPIFVEVLTLDRINGTEPFHGTGVSSTPRTELMVWTYQDILTNKIAGVSSLDFFANTRSMLVILGALAAYTFLYQFLKNRQQALFMLSLWSIFLLASIQADETGSDFISRILQDKFMGWFVIVPIVLVFMLWFLESRKKRHLAGFAIVTFGAALVHPITIIQAIMLIGSFGLLHLIIERSRHALNGLVIIGAVLLLCISIPVIQYIRYTNYMPIDLTVFICNAI